MNLRRVAESPSGVTARSFADTLRGAGDVSGGLPSGPEPSSWKEAGRPSGRHRNAIDWNTLERTEAQESIGAHVGLNHRRGKAPDSYRGARPWSRATSQRHDGPANGPDLLREQPGAARTPRRGGRRHPVGGGRDSEA